ncbi:MAG: hypothetical protein R2851_25165 [Caldilineaceae bacterium]
MRSPSGPMAHFGDVIYFAESTLPDGEIYAELHLAALAVAAILDD